MFGKVKFLNFNVWKSQILEFQYLENLTFRIPMFRKSQNLEYQYLEKTKLRIGILLKSQNLEFQCLEKAKG